MNARSGMVGLWLAAGMAALGLFAGSGAATQEKTGKPQSAATPTYARDLRPLLQARCIVCHNQGALDNTAVSGGLALDSYAALKKGVVGKSGARAVYTAGKSGESELIRRLAATSPTKLMPKGGPPLPPAQIALFKKWVDSGALAGAAGKGADASRPEPGALPMPANPGAQDVRFPTRISLPPDLRKKDTPEDATLALALKIGPLPPVPSLAFSPDGTRLAVGGYRAVTLWDTAQGRPAGVITHLSGPALALAFRPDGALLAVAGGAPGVSGEARIYDAKTLAPIGAPLTGHTDVITDIAWNAEGTRIATASQDKTARLREWPGGKALKVFRDHSDAVTRVCFAPDGKSLFTASQDRNVRRFDTESGQTLRVFAGHSDAVTALALSPDGKQLASSNAEARIRWWNLENGETARYSDGSGGQVNDLTFSKDGTLLLSGGADHSVRLWDVGGGGQKLEMTGSGDWLYAVALSPDGKLAAGAGAEGVARLWETATGRLRLTLASWPPAEKAAAPEWIALTPEGYFAASPGWSKRLRPLPATGALPAARSAALMQALLQPAQVLKAWQAAELEPASLPAPANAGKQALRSRSALDEFLPTVCTLRKQGTIPAAKILPACCLAAKSRGWVRLDANLSRSSW